MDITIVFETLQLDVYGFGGIAEDNNHTQTAFAFSGKMWDVVKAGRLKNKGKNIWIYEGGHKVFAGIELENPFEGIKHGLEKKTVSLEKYAFFIHVGPYSMIKTTGQNMINDLTKKGLELTLPYIEIYGHWVNDETKLETKLVMGLK